MKFPVVLCGKPTEVKGDWCRNCDDGSWRPVDTVKSPGEKGKPYCVSCWAEYMHMLLPAERGDVAAPLAEASASVTPWVAQASASVSAPLWSPAWVAWVPIAQGSASVCPIVQASASVGPMAQGSVGQIVQASAFASVAEPQIAAAGYELCKAPACAALWRKARCDGYCSWSCAEAHGCKLEEEYSLCKAPACAALWRKAR